MGNESSTAESSQEFVSASKRYAESELRDLKKLFVSLAYQSRSGGEYIIASVFQAHFGIHGSLGGRLFDLITQKRENKSLYYADLVIAKGLYEKGSADEAETFMYQLVDLTGDGPIQRGRRGDLISFANGLGIQGCNPGCEFAGGNSAGFPSVSKLYRSRGRGS